MIRAVLRKQQGAVLTVLYAPFCDYGAVKEKHHRDNVQKLHRAESEERKRYWKNKMAKEAESYSGRTSHVSGQMAISGEDEEPTVEDLVVRSADMSRNISQEIAMNLWRKQQLTRRRGTIKQKFFKDPQEVNLLTWDAKEQIRYLHAEYPDEWTVERLAESFPVSADGIRKLLRSTFRPRSLEVLIEHDLKVKRNWKLLSDGEYGKGPLAIRYFEMVRAGKIHQLAHAVGNTALPMPQTKFLPTGVKSLPAQPGPFTKMIKSYVEKQKKKEIEEKVKNEEEQREMYEQLKHANLQTLQAFLKTLPPLGEQSTAAKQFEEPVAPLPQIESGGTASVDYRKAFWYRDYSEDENELATAQSENVSLFDKLSDIDDISEKEGELDESMRENDADEFEKWKESRSHSLRVALRNETSTSHEETDSQLSFKTDEGVNDSELVLDSRRSQKVELSSDVTDPGMTDTGIVHSDNSAHFRSEQGSLYRFGDRDHDIQKYEENPIYKSMKVESLSIDGETTPSEYYLYDEETGYQHPYGKRDGSFESIKVSEKASKMSRDGTRGYKRGNIYFDEDGEFLFKSPE